MRRTVLRLLTFGLLGRVERKHRLRAIHDDEVVAIEKQREESFARHEEACRRLESVADRTIVLAEETMAMTGGTP